MAPISRRAFLKRTVAVGTGVVLYIYSDGRYRMVVQAAGTETYRLRIVHTNDHHARVEPVAVTIQSAPTSVARNFGGVARRKKIFDAIRAEVAAPGDVLDKNILFLDAGDVFQGTLWFNTYGGLADLEFYRALGYDAVTIGNHEFDKGDAPLADFITGATSGTYPTTPTITGTVVPGGTRLAGSNFPVVSANITVSGGPLQGKIQANVVKTVGTEKIGIFGLTTPDTKSSSSPSASVTFEDPIATATAQVTALQGQGCNKIIVLSHLGYDVDQQLATVAGIDLIVGGHSHTPLRIASDTRPLGRVADGAYPTPVTRSDGTVCLIVQDWEWGKWIGDITIGFDAQGNITGARSSGMGATSAGTFTGTIRPVWADGLGTRALLTGEEADVGANSAVLARIVELLPPITAVKTQQVGNSAVLLDGERNNVRARETNLGNLVADAFLEKTKTFNTTIAITNGGGIRTSIQAGNVTLGDVINVAPFGNTVVAVTLTGAQVIAALENGVSLVETLQGRFPQVAGMRFRWTRNRPAGNRIISVEVKDSTAASGYVAIDPAKEYRLATTNFILAGGDGYTAIAAGKNKIDTFFIDSDAIAEYITAKSPVSAAVEGRILQVRLTRLPLLLRLGTTATR